MRTLAAHVRRRYGAGPGHLVVSLAGLAVAVYGLVRIAQHPGAGRVFAYLAAAVVVHDLVLLPLYTLAYRGAWRAGRVGADPRRLAVFRHLLVPLVIAGTLLLVWFPLVLALPRFHPILTTSVDVFAPRWALVTAALFAASAVAYAVRALRARGWPATGA